MNLPGRLKLTTLGDLLGTLHRAGATGVLELQEPTGARAGQSHRIHLRSGLVDAVDTPLEHPRLGELLLREGALDRNALANLLRRLVVESELRTGEILVREGLVSQALVSAALRWQLRARLDAIYGVGDALVRFHVRRNNSRFGLGSVLTPRDFLHGRRRARRDATGLARAEGELRRAEAYRLLGLEPGAADTEVRRAFRKLAAEHHPDRHPDATASELSALVQRFTKLSQAYHTLSR